MKASTLLGFISGRAGSKQSVLRAKSSLAMILALILLAWKPRRAGSAEPCPSATVLDAARTVLLEWNRLDLDQCQMIEKTGTTVLPGISME